MTDKKGFTLIEVIVTIVVMALAATAFMTYLGRGFTRSAIPVTQVQSQYRLIQQMEIITSQYREQITANPTSFTLSAFRDNYVTGQPYVDSGKTGLITLTSGTYTTQYVLRVTLVDGDQTLMSIFTQ